MIDEDGVKKKKKKQRKKNILIKGEQSMEKRNEEGIANHCLMANANEVNSKSSSNFMFDE